MASFDDFTTDEQFKEFAGNKYLLVNVAAFRARLINEGVEVYVRTKNRHPLQIALEEIALGHINYSFGSDKQSEALLSAGEEIFRYDDLFDLETETTFDESESFEIDDVEFTEEMIDFDATIESDEFQDDYEE